MCRKLIRCRSQNFCYRRIIRHDERGQYLRHIGDAAPFVAGRGADWDTFLGEEFFARV